LLIAYFNLPRKMPGSYCKNLWRQLKATQKKEGIYRFSKKGRALFKQVHPIKTDLAL